MSKIVVFGGTGFIGEYVVRELRREGKECLVVDAATPRTKVAEYIAKATHIIWLAPPVPGLLEGLSKKLRAAPHLQKFLYASTLLLYRDSVLPQNEDAELEPRTEYEHKKFEEEGVVRKLFAAERLIIARLGSVYGDVKNRGIVGKTFEALRKGTPITINGDGSQRRDFIHAADVARLLTGLILEPHAQGVYNVCTGESSSIAEVIQRACDVAGRKVEVLHGPSVLEKHEVMGDNAKALELLAIPVRETLGTGLRKTCKQYFAVV